MTGYQVDGAGAGLALGLLGLCVLAWDRWRDLGRRPDSHGDSMWASGRDLRALHTDPKKVDGVVIGWQGLCPLRLPDEDNLLVFGVQRSGKTSTVVIPTLLSWPGAVVATSTKEELVALTGQHRTSRGPVHVFAPMDPDTGWVSRLGLSPVAWNPLSDVTTSGLSAEQGDLGMVLEFLNSTALQGYAVLGTQVGGRAKEILLGFARTPPEEAGSIISTSRAALSLWLDDRIVAATTKGSLIPQLDLDTLLASGGTLYLVAPAEDAERCRPLFTALLGSLLRRATAAARAQGGILQPRLVLALDEAANFARVPRLASYVSTGPGQGIQAVLCFHDLAQLRAAYGQDGAATIWNNCRARLLLPGQADPSTLDIFARALGQETVIYRQKTWGRGPASSSESRAGRPLQTPDQLRRSPNPILVFSSARPARLTLRRWDQVPQWRDLVDRASMPVAKPAA